MGVASLEIVEIPFEQLHGASWNANRVPKDVLAKIRRSLTEFGVVENSVVRPLPARCPYCELATKVPHYEIISGNHRSAIYREIGLPTMPCVIRDLTDGKARILAQVLNRTRGADDPDAYRILLEDTLEEIEIEEIVGFLPETEESIRKIVADVMETGDAPGLAEASLWAVVIECETEAEQVELIGRLTDEGHSVRALML